MAETVAGKVNGDGGKQRSPAYPSVSLEAAIARARVIHDEDGTNPATLDVVAEHWGASAKSSGFLQAIASLKRYGLLDELETGTGAARKVRLSKRALAILMLPPDDPQHRAAIRAAAIAPALFRQLWDTYGTQLPSDQNLTHTLVADHKFLPTAASDAINQYKKTIAFAGLSRDDEIAPPGDPGETPPRDRTVNDVMRDFLNRHDRPPQVGDVVQWESQGRDQFQTPRRVVGHSPDGSHVYVENSLTGLPVDQIRVVAAGKTNTMNPSPHEQSTKDPAGMPAPAAPTLCAPPTAPAGVRRDTMSLEEGEVALIYPANLSEQSLDDFKDWVTLAVRKIERTIKQRKADG